MKGFLTALSFLTILPINLKNISEDDFKISLRYYPIVGFLMGIIFYFISLLNISPDLKSGVIFGIWIVLTGALHLDGVADIFDALGALKNKEQAFQIMQDSRIGAIGTVAIVSLLILKFVLIKNAVLYSSSVLIFAPMCSRYAITFLSKRLKYAKDSGLGKFIVDNTDFETFFIASIFVLAVFVIVNIGLIYILLFFYLFLICISNFYYNKFQGVTGDMLGATVELSELFVMFTGLLALN